MKKILLMLFLCTCVSCNNNHEYKGIVINKEKVVTTRYIVQTLSSNAIINVTPVYSDAYKLTVKDNINNERKYYVNKKTYDEINIGDKYIN